MVLKLKGPYLHSPGFGRTESAQTSVEYENYTDRIKKLK